MTLYRPTLESVKFVAANMREADKEEIYPLRWEPTPDSLAHSVIAATPYAWLAVDGNTPVAAFGMHEARPKAWTAFAFGTDYFPKVAGEMTKFLCKMVRPHLFDELGARRVEAWSHGNHVQAHKWLEKLGAKGEPDPDYGPNGETYVRYVMRRADWDLLKAQKAFRIDVSKAENRTSPVRLAESRPAEHV